MLETQRTSAGSGVHKRTWNQIAFQGLKTWHQVAYGETNARITGDLSNAGSPHEEGLELAGRPRGGQIFARTFLTLRKRLCRIDGWNGSKTWS